MNHDVDVAVVGGGLAGSVAAAMLGRAGVATALIDPHAVYPPDFRCEKLDGVQTEILRKTGLAEPVLRTGTYDKESWVVHYGRVLDRRRGDQHGIMYDTLVNTLRGLVPPSVAVHHDKVADIRAGSERQVVTLAGGKDITARLAIVASGLSVSLLDRLGLKREVLSAAHSICLGFNLAPASGTAFDFPALTYYCDRPAERFAYITLFPIGAAMRANMFAYRDPQDPVFRQLRKEPVAAMDALMPRLRRIIGDYAVRGFVQIRPVDLYATQGYRQAGIVLVGDAFSTSCPAAGTGARKALNDVERLCNHLVPRWLATPGMGAEKIAQFYDDPVKRQVDDWCLDKAFSLRDRCTQTGWVWALRRSSRAAMRAGIGAMRAGPRAAAAWRRRAPRAVETVTAAVAVPLRREHPAE